MEEKFKPIKTIHIALVLGITLAYFLIGDLQNLDFLHMPETDTTLYLFLLIPIAAVFLGNMLYKQQLKNGERDQPLENKIGIYQTASLIRWAMVEGAAFLILFLKKELIIIGICLILYLVLLWPSQERMKRDFKMVGN
ncbi:MAG: MFS transporter [Allomuricauda sp.]|nr:MAG: MFS transporter [Allomuricauda sp.]